MVTLEQAAKAALRLIKEGLSLKHAVSLVSGTYGYTTDDLYKKINKLERNQ